MNKLALAFGACLLLTTVGSQADDAKSAASYTAECGSCHVPFPTRLLSSGEWRKITSHLDKHFGVDATLDAATIKTIDQYLSANSDQRNRTTASGNQLPRITESQWFKHKHSEIGPKVWQRLNIKSLSSCNACHADLNMRRAY